MAIKQTDKLANKCKKQLNNFEPNLKKELKTLLKTYLYRHKINFN